MFMFLSGAEIKFIKKKGILIDTSSTETFSEIYSNERDSIFITEDFIFHIYALYYRKCMEEIRDTLYERLKDFLIDMYVKSYEQYMVERDFMKGKWDMVLLFLNSSLLLASENISPPPNIAPLVYSTVDSLKREKQTGDSLELLLNFFLKDFTMDDDSLFSFILLSTSLNKDNIGKLKKISDIISILYRTKTEIPLLNLYNFLKEKGYTRVGYDKNLIEEVRKFINEPHIGIIKRITQEREDTLSGSMENKSLLCMKLEMSEDYPIKEVSYERKNRGEHIYIEEIEGTHILFLDNTIKRLKTFLNDPMLDSLSILLTWIKEGRGREVLNGLLGVCLERETKICKGEVCLGNPWRVYIYREGMILKGAIFSVHINHEIPQEFTPYIRTSKK